MLSDTNIKMGIRLALISDRGERASASALLFENGRAARGTQWAQQPSSGHSSGLGPRSSALPLDPAADVEVRELELSNTLLASAVRSAQHLRCMPLHCLLH